MKELENSDQVEKFISTHWTRYYVGMYLKVYFKDYAYYFHRDHVRLENITVEFMESDRAIEMAYLVYDVKIEQGIVKSQSQKISVRGLIDDNFRNLSYNK